MWGRLYWGRKEGEVGIVVVFAWLASEERHLDPYLDLYSALGWSSLVCHCDFLTLFFPEKATALADSVLKELSKELKVRSLPVVLAPFSGGSKGCMYKVIQLIYGKREGQLNPDQYKLVRDCVCGQIYDSGPVDFTSDMGTRFALHPTVLKMSQPPRIISWMAKAFASGLDTLFISRFEAQRAEFWQTLYSSVHLLEQGALVNLVKWGRSPHVGHYKNHPDEYRTAVADLLSSAAITYFKRRRQHFSGNSMVMADPCNRIPESVCDLHTAAVNSNESLKRVATDPTDHFFLPSSMEYNENQEESKDELFHMPSINPHGVLSQILFDVCVPKNIEGWDIKHAASVTGRQRFGSSRHSPLNPVKCIRRSRL
ncbi:hypothetical protein ACMD2_02144 [Ananas comosus]|uniref:Uncharacterized protein n=1 Tax=Ananas comosus TaxID=4615 RepID=A0A199UPI3_ANACO|nr:hypothetical protein ACMD2_02144 [Ananas comosus]